MKKLYCHLKTAADKVVSVFQKGNPAFLKVKEFFVFLSSRCACVSKKAKQFFGLLSSRCKPVWIRFVFPFSKKVALLIGKGWGVIRPATGVLVRLFRQIWSFVRRSFYEVKYHFLAANSVAKQDGIQHGFVCFWKLLWRWTIIHQRFLRHAFNYLIIVAFIPVMVALVNYYGSMTVALKLNVNGTEIGYIEEAAVYEEAYATLQSRLIRTEDEQNKICVPIYSVAFVSTQQLMDSDEVCESLMRSTYEDVTYAYGLYSASELIGVLEDKQSLGDLLDDYIETFRGMYDDCEVSFADAIEIEEGYYPGASLTTQADLIALLAKTSLEQMDYIAEEGDTYETIAELFAMSKDRLFELNNIDAENLPVSYTQQGEKEVGVVHSGDIFRVEYVKYALDIKLSYTDEYVVAVEYETIRVADPSHYIGYSYVQQEGITGSIHETAKISYVYGIETEREILNSSVITKKQDKILVVGTRASAALKDSSDFYAAKYYWPVKKVKGSFISAYYGDGRNHLGIDIAAPKNTEIYAGDTGVVSAVGFEKNGYGWYVRITHSDGYQTFYAHCNEVLVKLGESVSRGDLIAYVGTTGFSTGYHLHFEVRFGRDRLDPYTYLGLTGYSSSIPPSVSTEPEKNPDIQKPDDETVSSSDVSSSNSSQVTPSNPSDTSSPSSSEGNSSNQTVSSQPPTSSAPKEEPSSSKQTQ